MQKSLKQLRQKSRYFYKNIGKIYCPYFKEEIRFNSEGFNHIRYRKARKERHKKVQEIRYKLLKFAPKVIWESSTLQEYSTDERTQFYGFIAILDGWKIKVIIRQTGDGQKHFWSIIPNWQTRRTKEGKKIFQNHTGNPTAD